MASPESALFGRIEVVPRKERAFRPHMDEARLCLTWRLRWISNRLLFPARQRRVVKEYFGIRLLSDRLYLQEA